MFFGLNNKDKNKLLQVVLNKDFDSFKKYFNNNHNDKWFEEILPQFKNYLNDIKFNSNLEYKIEKYLNLFDNRIIRLNDYLSKELYEHLNKDYDFLKQINLDNLNEEQNIAIHKFISSYYPKVNLVIPNNKTQVHLNLDLEKLNVLNKVYNNKHFLNQKYFDSIIDTIFLIENHCYDSDKEHLYNSLKINLYGNKDLEFVFDYKYLLNFINQYSIANYHEEVKLLVNKIYDPFEIYNYLKKDTGIVENIDYLKIFFNNYEALIEQKTRLLLDGLKYVYYPKEKYQDIKNIISTIEYMQDKDLKQKLTEKIYNEVADLSGTLFNVESFNIKDHDLKLETKLKDLTKDEFLELIKIENTEIFYSKKIEEIFEMEL